MKKAPDSYLRSLDMQYILSDTAERKPTKTSKESIKNGTETKFDVSI